MSLEAIAVLSTMAADHIESLDEKLRFLDLAAWAKLRKSNFFLSFQVAQAEDQFTAARSDVLSSNERRLASIKTLLENEHLTQPRKEELQVLQTAFGSSPMTQKVLYMLQDPNRIHTLKAWFPSNVPCLTTFV